MKQESKMDVLLDYLRDNPHKTNKEIDKDLNLGALYIRQSIYTMKARGWLTVEGTGSERKIQVIKREPVDLKEFKQDIYVAMIPQLLVDFESSTSIADRSLTFKNICKALENIG